LYFCTKNNELEQGRNRAEYYKNRTEKKIQKKAKDQTPDFFPGDLKF
jgi:hypothetical protein